MLPAPIRNTYFRVRHGDAVDRENPTIDPDFATRVGLDRTLAAPEPVVTGRSARERQVRLLSDPKLQRTLEIENAIANVYDVEPCYPFLDRRLMELCVSLPGRVKLRDGTGRWVLRQAMDGVLPETIRMRHNKADFSPYIIASLQTHDREYVEKTANGSDALWRYVDEQAHRQVLRRCLGRNVTNEREREGSYGANSAVSIEDARVLAINTAVGRWLQTVE
jgi:asparagine synthase (glutamine-hydrolysing)